MDDAQIINLYFARDENAIVETKNKYQNMCYIVAHNILYSREDSEECVVDYQNKCQKYELNEEYV